MSCRLAQLCSYLESATESATASGHLVVRPVLLAELVRLLALSAAGRDEIAEVAHVHVYVYGLNRRRPEPPIPAVAAAT
eukprot:15475496-Alexandrium_andersonii.AAC.1